MFLPFQRVINSLEKVLLNNSRQIKPNHEFWLTKFATLTTKSIPERSFIRNGLAIILYVLLETKNIPILPLLPLWMLRSIVLPLIKIADTILISRWENQKGRFKKNTENGKKPKRVKHTWIKKGRDTKRTMSK